MAGPRSSIMARLGSSSFGDPSLIWREVDGKFYLFTLHSSGLGLWRSDDDCTTFTFVGNPHTGGGDDKELAAVDNDLGSPYYGRIYMAWTNFSAGGAIQFDLLGQHDDLVLANHH